MITSHPYAAGWNEEELHFGDIVEDAIDAALEDLEDALERGDADPDAFTLAPQMLEVFHGCRWCDGKSTDPGDEMGDCECGGHHEDGRWLLVDWERKEKLPLSVRPRAGAVEEWDVEVERD